MIVILMGVSGSGKSTVGELLAQKMDCSFFDGDDFHPPENVAKMASGQPLNDEDRLPWLLRLNDLMHGCRRAGKHGILACSALKQSYRKILAKDIDDICFVHLKGDYQTIFDRMAKRTEHYMGARMLQSQFDALEDPADALVIEIHISPEEIVSKIETHLSQKGGS